MPFEESYHDLEQMLLAKSTDHEKMLATLRDMRQFPEITRMLGPAQDNLYASIARGHRKALVHLESGDSAAAMREMAGAVSWFLRRFGGVEPESLTGLPKVADELRASRALAERSEVLKAALSQSHSIHAD